MKLAGAPIRRCIRAAAAAIRPPDELSVADWAERNRVLTGVESAVPGEWRNDRTPYLVGIMEALSSEHRAETVVFMKGAQVGGTEVGNNWVGYAIDHDPGPMLVLQATLEIAESWSKERLSALIATTPALKRKVAAPRSRGGENSIRSKRFPGGVLNLAGGNSAAGLRSRPVRRLFLDEVDSYDPDVDGEGDPVALAIQRTVTFANRKVYLVSTPTEKSRSRIARAYEDSDQRRYFVPCPHCGHEQWLKWAGVIWPEGEPEKAAYVCGAGDRDENGKMVGCGTLIEHRHKASMLAAGKWVATAEGDGRVVGFHLSALYSPFSLSSWGALAREFVAAKGSPEALKAFVNTKLGEVWDDMGGEGIDPTSLWARREDYGHPLSEDGPPRVPDQVQIITAGVDVQKDRLELEIVGWGAGEESWSIDYKVLYGDPMAPEVWRLLDAQLGQSFARESGNGTIGIRAACIDTGYGLEAVADYCRPRFGRCVWAIKGDDGKRPVWPRRPTKSDVGKITMFIVGADTAKDIIYARLRLGPGPGYCHWPKRETYDELYFDGLTVEKKLTKYHKGFQHAYWWKPNGARNEPLDCRVYAYAGLRGLLSMGVRLQAVEGRAPSAKPSKAPSRSAASKRPKRERTYEW